MLQPRHAARVLAFTLALITSPAVVSSAAPPAPWGDLAAPETEAILAQDLLPAWAAREASAKARSLALEAVFSGDRPLHVAVPQLGAMALDELPVVEGRLRSLEGASERRAGERARLTAAIVANRPLVGVIEPAWTAMADAEDRADALERRLLLALKGWLREHAWARGEGREALLAPLRRRVVNARATLDAPDAEAQLTKAARAAQEIARTEELLRRLRDVAVAGAAPVPEPDEVLPVEAPFETRYGTALRLAMLAQSLQEASEQDLVLARLKQATEALTHELEPFAERELEAAELWDEAVRHAPEGLRPALQALADAIREQVEAQTAHAEEVQSTVAEAEQARLDPNAAAAFTAKLIEARLPAERRLQERTEASKAQRETLQQAYEDARSRLEASRETLLSAIEAGRAADRQAIDERYRALPALLAELRERARTLDGQLREAQRESIETLRRIEAERSRIREERQALLGVTEADVHRRRAEALDRWEDVLEREERLGRSRLSDLQDARNRVLALIPEVASVRSDLSRWASASARAEDRSGLLLELVDELSMVRPTYAATVRARWHRIQENPYQLLDLGVISSFIFGSFSLLLGAILWIAARRYSDVIIQAIIGYLHRVRHIGSLDLERLKPMLRRAVGTLVDVLGALLLLRFVPADLPELSVLLLLLFEIQLLRLVQATYDLAFAKAPSRRPALGYLEESAWKLGRRMALLVALWVAIRRVLLAFANDLLAGFATEHLVRVFAGWTLVAMILLFAYAWAPHLRKLASREVQEGWVRRWVALPPPTVLLNGPQSIGSMLVILYFAGRRWTYWLARRSAGARWLSALDVLRFGRSSRDEAKVERTPLTDEVKQKVLKVAAERVFIDRPKAREAIAREVQDWHRDDQQGLIALLGDAGEGLDTAIEHWSTAWKDQGFSLRKVMIDRRLKTKSDALSWLTEAFELPEVPTDVEQAAELLGVKLEPGLIVVDRMNHAFLRSVGGFEAVRTLLEVFHADGFDRCWILAFYRPSWRYLERLGTSVNVHLVRAVIDLVPLTAQQLRELAKDIAEQVELELDFSELARTGALAASAEQELEHAIDAYYRLLLGASAGNPSVAIGLWLGCLDDVGEGRVKVYISDALRGAGLPDLSDDHLFVLAAIRTHRSLTEAELVEVLNMAHIQVRAMVRQMIAMGLLSRDHSRIEIRRLRLPAVTLLLRRRHFLHWS
ncbi:MAG: hypothetical protein EA397_02455 [Deltaproteobacteria bacterium]|nr:MAG: hypothetical protein EA397_02455 [Deltaproteobacteria bacterium]